MKIYMASWGHDFHKQEVRMVKEKFFNKGKGYDEYDIQLIRDLNIGQTWISDTHSSHIVTCIGEKP